MVVRRAQLVTNAGHPFKCVTNELGRVGIESHQTILLARGTRTIRICSSDARSEGQSGDSHWVRRCDSAEKETKDPCWTAQWETIWPALKGEGLWVA
jgi:phage terminase large subunit-like protein